MAKKATRKRKAKIRVRVRLPLEDERWRPAGEIIDRLLPHIGDKGLIAADLNKRLVSGKVHSLHRVIDRLPEVLLASYWEYRQLTYWTNGEARVALRLPGPQWKGVEWLTWVDGTFYFWLPDCEREWSVLAPKQIEESKTEASEPLASEPLAGEPLRRKPGPRPTRGWKLFIASKLYDLQRAGKPTPPATDLAQLCEDELDYQPDISHLQRWLRQLLD
jgi:hypothetical protein